MHRYKRKSKGFTLAEVLFTLTVIGVVAAMTIPSLMIKIDEAKWKPSYKAAFSDASQALLSGIREGAFVPSTAENDDTINFKAFASQFKTTKTCYNNNNAQCLDETGEHMTPNNAYPGLPTPAEYAFIDNSGRNWSLYYNQESIYVVDTNGFAKPNKFGKDRWIIRLIVDNKNYPIKFVPFQDRTSVDWYCHYPPCYLRSWLYK